MAHELAASLSPLWMAPFTAMLLAIAILPLATPRLWESNGRKLGIAVLLSFPVLSLYLMRAPATLLHVAGEYTSFMVLLGSLFVISGGVLLTGDLRATPAVNTAFLLVGSLLASFIGTTGASMLLLRPLLATNSERRHVTHTIVFFIFLVSNIGGSLTPLGDPPLFLGYLRGVPFLWTLRLAPLWLTTVLLLAAIYYLWDRRAYGQETIADLRRDEAELSPLRIAGWTNVLLLCGVMGCVALLPAPARELAMTALAGLSLLTTSRELRQANRFSFRPVLEVAALFIGIFVTMSPALEYLRLHGAELGLHSPWQFFWASGLLSSFLDNAPTYLTFLALGQGLHLTPEVAGVSHSILLAISAGAVFMGANSYIGNGPNFMVRAIAEEQGVRMPSFGGYLLYSGAILLPVFAVLTLVFFR
jgi:Na+/H+ antiporter NhaD/arsenite permease-like protein